MTEHDLPRPQLVHEHVEHYLWEIMCGAQQTTTPRGYMTPYLMDLWIDSNVHAREWVQRSVQDNYIIQLENTK